MWWPNNVWSDDENKWSKDTSLYEVKITFTPDNMLQDNIIECYKRLLDTVDQYAYSESVFFASLYKAIEEIKKLKTSAWLILFSSLYTKLHLFNIDTASSDIVYKRLHWSIDASTQIKLLDNEKSVPLLLWKRWIIAKMISVLAYIEIVLKGSDYEIPYYYNKISRFPVYWNDINNVLLLENRDN